MCDLCAAKLGNGWRLIDTLDEDRGYSASRMKRAGFSLKPSLEAV
mgnify:CR=1 FL=1